MRSGRALYDRAAHPAGRALAQLLDRPAVAMLPSFAQGPASSLAAATGQTSLLDLAHDRTMRERLRAASAKVRSAGGHRAAVDAMEAALASDPDGVRA